jgi:hypothetical protein
VHAHFEQGLQLAYMRAAKSVSYSGLLSFPLLCIESNVFRDVVPYIPFKVNIRFGGTVRLHLQCQRLSPVRNQHKTDIKIDTECPSETSLTFNSLSGIISQMTELCLTGLSLIGTCLTLIFVVVSQKTSSYSPLRKT